MTCWISISVTFFLFSHTHSISSKFTLHMVPSKPSNLDHHSNKVPLSSAPTMVHTRYLLQHSSLLLKKHRYNMESQQLPTIKIKIHTTASATHNPLHSIAKPAPYQLSNVIVGHMPWVTCAIVQPHLILSRNVHHIPPPSNLVKCASDLMILTARLKKLSTRLKK